MELPRQGAPLSAAGAVAVAAAVALTRQRLMVARVDERVNIELAEVVDPIFLEAELGCGPTSAVGALGTLSPNLGTIARKREPETRARRVLRAWGNLGLATVDRCG